MKGDLKMKAKSIFAASLLVAGAAFADTTTVDTEYVLGVLPVAVTNETIVAIPWIEAGGASAGIAVTNLIKTATLAVGDILYWYDPSANKGNGSYYTWKVSESAGVKYWENVLMATEGLTVAAGADNASLLRGQAAFLKRTDSCVTTNIYVVGQYTNAVANTITTTIAAKKDTNIPSYTLLAPPYAEMLGSHAGYIDLNDSSIDWGSPTLDDAIIVGIKYVTFKEKTVGVQDKYVWGTDSESKSGWGKYNGTTFTRSAEVPVGKGLWYVSYRTSPGEVNWFKSAQ